MAIGDQFIAQNNTYDLSISVLVGITYSSIQSYTIKQVQLYRSYHLDWKTTRTRENTFAIYQFTSMI